MKTKKIIASALAFIMATTVAASNVFAAGETVKISASKAEVEAGAPFSVDISFSGVPATAIKGCEFAVKYDSSVLSITGVEAGEITNTGADSAENDISGESPAFFEDHSTAGTINLTWATGLNDSGYWIAKDGVFATISGTVAAGAKAGEYPIEIVAISRDDLDGVNNSIYVGYLDNGKAVEYETAVTNGAVIVGAVTTVTTGTTVTTDTTTTTTTTTSAGGETTTTKKDDTEVKYGDVNLDSKITMVDMVYMTKYLTGAVKFNDNQKANGDCAKDGAVDASDATALLQFLGEKIEVLPVQVG